MSIDARVGTGLEQVLIDGLLRSQTHLYLCTLGSFSLQLGDRKLPSLATQKARALLTYLVLHRATDVGRERLMEMFWPEAEPDRARNNLNTALWSIRRSLRDGGLNPDEYLVATRTFIRWIGDTTSDIAQFHALVAQSDPAAQKKALALYAGEFLEGDYEEWTVAEREKAAREYELLLSSVVLQSGDAKAAQLLIDRNPYDEGAYVTLIDAELAAGRLGAAAALVNRCRAALLEVGSSPSAHFESRFGNITSPGLYEPHEFHLPFAGRGGELGALQMYLREANNGNGRVVLVHGDPGIGKSTLFNRAAELAHKAGARVIIVNAIQGDSRTFGPWEELFKAVSGKNFDANTTRTDGRVDIVAKSLAGSITPGSMIVVDDAHALQGEALKIFIAFATQAIRNFSHLLVVGSRPEGVRSLRALLQDLPIGELHILGLSRSELDEALQRGACEAPGEFVDLLYVRTGGHPFFIVSLLNAMASGGSLRFADRRWTVVSESTAYAELPDSLRRHIESRLNARGECAFAVACAFALDPASTADDLVDVTKLGETRVFDALDDLLALGLLVQPSSGPQFAFSHEMVRDVAASLLHAGRRARLHRAFASRLAQRAEPDSSLRRARHLSAAGDALAAGEAYLQAAREALNLHALQEASERCANGIAEIELLEQGDHSDKLLAQLMRFAAEIRLINAPPRTSVAEATEALGLARQSRDDRALLRALLTRQKALLHVYRVDEALEAAHESERLAKQQGDEEAFAMALADVSWALRLSGRGRDAIEAANTALEHANQAKRWPAVAEATEQVIRCGITWWHFDRAIGLASAGMEAARRSDIVATASFHICRGELYFALERLNDATEELRTAHSILDEKAVSATRSIAPLQQITLSWIRLSLHALDCVLGIARGRWDEALNATERLAGLGALDNTTPLGERIIMLRLDALLGRGTADDERVARELGHSLAQRSAEQDTFAWSRCPALSKARTARNEAEVANLLEHALDVLEENGQATPLDADRAFSELAQSAQAWGNEIVSKRAILRRQYYRSHRIATAGPNWGGAIS